MQQSLNLVKRAGWPEQYCKMLRPFHLAFPIKDIAATREFYVKMLGCIEGRSTVRWIDFDFFGNQISAHVHKNMDLDLQNEPMSEVDNKPVPLKHFGAVLTWQQFYTLADRLKQHNVKFIIEPQIRYPGLKGNKKFLNRFYECRRASDHVF